MNRNDWSDGLGEVLATLLMEESAACLVVVDETFHIRFVSEAAARLLGWDRAEVVGKSGDALLPPAYAAERRTLTRQVCDSGQTLTFMETLRGWRCRTRVRPLPADANGVKRIGVHIQPVALEAPGAPPSNGQVIMEARHNDGDALAVLTRQEREVLRHIGLGYSTDEIAARLSRSPKTIEFHRAALGRKLRVSNKVELVLIAIRAGLANMNTRPPTGLGADDGVSGGHALVAAASPRGAAHSLLNGHFQLR